MKQLRQSSGVRATLFAQKGLSLVELMVSIVISLLIMVAILQLYLDITRTNDEMAKTNAQIESGRFTIQLLQDEIAHAGYWGGYVPQFDDLTTSDNPAGVPPLVQGTPRFAPDPCDITASGWSDDEKDALLGIPIQVFDAVLTGCSMPDKLAGTDVLVVRHAATAVGCTSPSVCVQVAFCAAEMPGYWLGEGTAVTALQNMDCATPSPTRRLVSNIYWIKDIGGIPTLVRQEFGAADAQPLIEGIEGFKVELGIDDVSKTGGAVDYSAPVDFAGGTEDRSDPINRGDGVSDSFVRCPTGGCSFEQLRNVVSVKLYILARNLTATPGYEDPKEYCLESPELDADDDCTAEALFQPDATEKKFKRHLFSTNIRLMNVSGRRETP